MLNVAFFLAVCFLAIFFGGIGAIIVLTFCLGCLMTFIGIRDIMHDHSTANIAARRMRAIR